MPTILARDVPNGDHSERADSGQGPRFGPSKRVLAVAIQDDLTLAVARQVDLPREHVTRVAATTAPLCVAVLPPRVVMTAALRRAGFIPVAARPSAERLADIAIAVALAALRVAPVAVSLAVAASAAWPPAVDFERLIGTAWSDVTWIQVQHGDSSQFLACSLVERIARGPPGDRVLSSNSWALLTRITKTGCCAPCRRFRFGRANELL